MTLIGGAAVWPLAAQAQQARKPLIGLLLPGSQVASKRFVEGFLLGMQQRGYLEARDYSMEIRYADSNLRQLPLLAEELVRQLPNVIVTGTSIAAIAAKQTTATVPIVGVNMVDPVADGLIENESRPGTNLTGTRQYLPGLQGKQLELTQDLVPSANKIGFLSNTGNAANAVVRKETEAAAAKLGLTLVTREVRDPDGFDPSFRSFASDQVKFVLVLRDVLFFAKRQQIAAFALSSRLPTMYSFREHVESGGLISYGVDLRESYRYAGFYVDKILKGERAADLPIEFPTKLELVINLTTAKAIGLTIPATVLARADEVIE
jgi:putative ABC transport system substrate-binding protein